MEKTIKAKFVTDFYGSAPALGAQEVLIGYIDKELDKGLLSFASQLAKKSEKIGDKVAEILSIFHRDKDGNPVLGNWMLRRCLVLAGEACFNAMKDKSHPKKAMIQNGIICVEPIPHISLYNGKLIGKPDGVKTYTVTVKGRSFFKAYEYIKAGATFQADVVWDDNMLSDEHMGIMLKTAGRLGVGAFRERYGKFELV